MDFIPVPIRILATIICCVFVFLLVTDGPDTPDQQPEVPEVRVAYSPARSGQTILTAQELMDEELELARQHKQDLRQLRRTIHQLRGHPLSANAAPDGSVTTMYILRPSWESPIRFQSLRDLEDMLRVDRGPHWPRRYDPSWRWDHVLGGTSHPDAFRYLNPEGNFLIEVQRRPSLSDILRDADIDSLPRGLQF